jgi:hypothetical protein
LHPYHHHHRERSARRRGSVAAGVFTSPSTRGRSDHICSTPVPTCSSIRCRTGHPLGFPLCALVDTKPKHVPTIGKALRPSFSRRSEGFPLCPDTAETGLQVTPVALQCCRATRRQKTRAEPAACFLLFLHPFDGITAFLHQPFGVEVAPQIPTESTPSSHSG